MSRSRFDRSEPSRRLGTNHPYYGPVAWIVVLLAGWLVITEWHMLPELITSTMAALP